MKRYSRQSILAQIGEEGQARLAQARVAIVGCGGLGSIAAPYLAGAGVGCITLIDADTPDISNLHRQVIYSTGEQRSKAEALAGHLRALNPEIEVVAHSVFLRADNVDELLSSSDMVLECSDDIMTKYLANDYCHVLRIPLVYGALSQFDGQVSLFDNRSMDSIHLRDIFAEPDLSIASCAEAGVLGTVAGSIGLIQATEAIKWIVGFGEPLTGKCLTYDALSHRQMIFKIRKTYTKDMSEQLKQNDYTTAQTCADYELTLQDVQDKRSDYTLISILESWEHEALDDATLHIPLAEVVETDLDLSKHYVFYCKSGRRSGMLTRVMRDRHPKGTFYSLQGGKCCFSEEC